MWRYGVAQNQHCNNDNNDNDDNDDNVMRSSMGLNSLVDYFNVKIWYMEGKCDNKEGDLNWAHPFPRIYDKVMYVLQCPNNLINLC